MKIKIGYCKDCRGMKISTIDSNYERNKENREKLKQLRCDVGSVLFTLNENKYEKVKTKFNLAEIIMTLEEFEQFNGADCGCTKICKKIRSFSDACKLLKMDDAVFDYGVLPKDLRVRMQAMYKLIIITKALNEGWEPGYNNANIYEAYYATGFYNSDREFPYKHEYGSSECYSTSDIDYNGGVLLMFKEWGLANYAGNQFRQLYLDLYQYPEAYLNRYNNE